MKNLRKHPQAVRDISAATAHYAHESVALSDRFLDEIAAALERVRQMPGSGSPRFAYDLDMPELRARSLISFPYLLFYLEREKTIDLVRVLHSHRDILAMFLER